MIPVHRIRRRERGPEATLQDAAIADLRKCGFWAWAVTCGVATRRGHYWQMMPPGTPDIRIEPYGWVETKTLKGKLSPAQRRWHRRARLHGVNVATLQDRRAIVETACKWREEWRR